MSTCRPIFGTYISWFCGGFLIIGQGGDHRGTRAQEGESKPTQYELHHNKRLKPVWVLRAGGMLVWQSQDVGACISQLVQLL